MILCLGWIIREFFLKVGDRLLALSGLRGAMRLTYLSLTRSPLSWLYLQHSTLNKLSVLNPDSGRGKCECDLIFSTNIGNMLPLVYNTPY